MNNKEISNYYEEERLFWVVDSSNTNEEIFPVRQDALEYIHSTKLGAGARLRICIVKHAYQEDSEDFTGEWNYDDFSDTFETVKVVKL